MVSGRRSVAKGAESDARSRTNAESGEKLALIQWRSGPDNEVFTPNCPVKWITDFDEDEWDKETVYGVEWRKPPKPSRGWPIFDAVVLEDSRANEPLWFLSGNSSFLETCLRKYQDDASDDHSSSSSLSRSPAKTSSDVDSNSKAMQQMIEHAIGKATAHHSPKQPSTGSELGSARMVDIGHDVLIPAHLYTLAMASRTPTKMTCSLLQAAYKTDSHLIGKTYAGQKKTFKNENGEISVRQKPGIKKRKKIVAIKKTVIEKFPDFTQGSFGQCINNYIAKLRLPSRQTFNEQLEDDTDEEA
ncbi:Rab3 GTPase-activating protein catalytic subunit [Frankliniella fusca]|uniref:Rab3 GTPase-activating protein catalytic subunit n=1 Tax=Frankliniella fusca TaxID=407009 RepID=A0AAE1HEN6_9NEOP|nr:Rab3 GTPase-activating protein catalytic subunit [Frankliniella fusca]